MTKVAVYNTQGEKVSDQELSAKVFGVALNPNVVHQVVVAQQANARVNVASTKDRSQVQGGGRKPWRQKGTGRARHGSSRSPIWRGGGVTFGPNAERNYGQKVNKQVRQKALLMSLSDKATNEKIMLVDQLELKEMKTKAMNEILQNLSLRKKAAKASKAKATEKKETKKVKQPSVLLVLPKADANIQRSARNIVGLDSISANSLNAVEVLKHDTILMPVGSLEVIEKTYSK